MIHASRTIKTLTLNGITVSLLPKRPYCARYTPRQPVAGFAFESQEGVHALASDRIRSFYAVVNGFAFTPAGCSIYSEAAHGGEYLTLSGKADRLVSLLSEERGYLPLEQFTGRIDPQAIRAAHALRRLLLRGASEPVLVETALAGPLHAVCGYHHFRREMPGWAWSMTPRRLQAVEALIEAQLAAPLTLRDLAAACELSPGFFLRAFKAATGQTPHRFLMERRIAHARQMLEQKSVTVAEAAYLTGVSSHAHLKTAFKRGLGLPPSEYRQK